MKERSALTSRPIALGVLALAGAAGLLLAAPTSASPGSAAPIRAQSTAPLDSQRLDDLSHFPASVTYRGRAVDRQGKPLSGRLGVEVRYLSGGHEQFSESYSGVVLEDGRFSLELGRGRARTVGASGIATLQKLFSRHPELCMELRIGSVLQQPQVRLLPAGHSAAGMRALSGPVPAEDGKPHSKFYEARSGATAIEAAILRPTGAAGAASDETPDTVARPFEVEVEGPWLSQPLRDQPTLPPVEGPLPAPTETNRPRHETLYDADGYLFGTRNQEVVDSLAASSLNPEGIRTPAPLHDFAGMDNTQNYYPPDTHGAVGPNHYIQVVNVKFRVFNKDGTPAAGEFNTNTLWTAMGGSCATNNSGDAIFVYDEPAGRWVLTQFAVASAPERVCLAISQTGDPLGSYYLYSVVTQRFPDYFKIGVWPDPSYNAYFMTTNSGSANQYDVYALDRENMLAGLAARPAQFFQSYPNLLMPADLDGVSAPPAGTGGLLYTILDGTDPYFVPSPGVDTLRLYEYKVNWATPASSTISQVAAYTPASGGLAAFNWSVCGFFAMNCLSQPGTSVRIDTASWWPMQRFVYRNFGTHESLYGTWTVDVTGTPDLAAPRWFELRRSGGTAGTWALYQQGTYSPDGDHRWMGSIAADRDGNIALGYSVVNAGTSLYPSIRYTTRAVGDPLGTMQAEQTLHVGTGSQTGSAGRWGDYSSMTVDPTDDCTFWFTTEFLETTGNVSWKTRIGTFQVPGCGGMAVTPTTQSVCSSVGNVDFGLTLYDLFTGTTNLTVSACPTNATCLFTPNPVVNPASTSNLNVSNLGAVPAGLYNFDAVATDSVNPAITRNVPLALRVWPAAPGVATLTAPVNGATNVAVRPTFQWSAVAETESYRLQVASDLGFVTLVLDQAGIGGTSFTPTTDLPSNTPLFWRVIASNPCGVGVTSAAFGFTTVPLPGDCSLGASAQSVFSESFDGTVSGWSSAGTGNTWAISTARFHSGPSSYKAVDPGTASDQQLTSPPIVLPNNPELTLQFWNHQTMEPRTGGCWDGGLLEISTDGGTVWNQIPTASMLTDPYNGPLGSGNPLAPRDAWCGDPQDWLNSVVNLSSYAGQTVRFRFRMSSDGSVSREGWYLDDVKVQACLAGIFVAGGFETGDLSQWSAFTP